MNNVNEYDIGDSKYQFCNRTGDPQIKRLSDEQLSSVISASEHDQDNVRETIQ